MNKIKHGNLQKHFRSFIKINMAIEDSQKFKKFLIAFGVKGIEEYRTFTEEQKRICIREYLKTFRK